MHKRTMRSLIILIIAITMLCGSVSVYADTFSYYVTPTSSTPLYQSASTSSYSYGTVDSGDVMGVKSTSGEFYYVYVGGRYGYVLQSYCRQTTSTNITQPSQSISKYLYTVTGTTLYSQANGYSSMLASIPSGSYIGIVSTSGDYYYVYYNNQYGYIPISAFGGTTSGTFTVTTISSTAMYSTTSGGTMVGIIPAGVRVTVNSTSGSYYNVSYGNTTGYAAISSFMGSATGNAFSTSTYTGGTTTTTTANTDGAVAYGTVTAGAALLKTPGGVTTATFPSGGQVGIISKTSGGYYYITANGTRGYVAATSLSTSSTNIPVSDATASGTATIAPSGGKSAKIGNCKNNVNMRAEPSSSSTLLGAVPKGASITAYKKSGSYTQINYNGTTGYVLSKYVKK